MSDKTAMLEQCWTIQNNVVTMLQRSVMHRK